MRGDDASFFWFHLFQFCFQSKKLASSWKRTELVLSVHREDLSCLICAGLADGHHESRMCPADSAQDMTVRVGLRF